MEPHVTNITVEFSDGSSFEMEYSTVPMQSGTAYWGNRSERSEELESRINDAVNELTLFPYVEGE